MKCRDTDTDTEALIMREIQTDFRSTNSSWKHNKNTYVANKQVAVPQAKAMLVTSSPTQTFTTAVPKLVLAECKRCAAINLRKCICVKKCRCCNQQNNPELVGCDDNCSIDWILD